MSGVCLKCGLQVAGKDMRVAGQNMRVAGQYMRVAGQEMSQELEWILFCAGKTRVVSNWFGLLYNFTSIKYLWAMLNWLRVALVPGRLPVRHLLPPLIFHFEFSSI